ncbi:MAG: HupE/UreJ family protein [Acidobacteriota bacterium]|nr:MAG: HupE/UreJ family protein [Acidobacteriota bacterium]
MSFGIHGFHHILQGYDHLLFLLGLLVVTTSLRMTIGIVTAFTLDHSISLALAALQIVTVPRGLLECTIALTIMWVAVENIFSWFPLKRWLLSLAFGLIHGLAFAETLDILGLPVEQLVLALFSFNVGIEVAQVAVVLIAIPFTLKLAERKWRLQAVQALSLPIFAFATFWFVQRTLPLFS